MKTVRAGLAAVAAAVIICLQSGAPGNAQTAQQQPKPSGGKNLCVASALGHTFWVQKIGIMVFGNSLDEVPTGSWGIDDFVVSRIQSIVTGKYAIRRLPLSAQNLSALEAADAGGLLFGGSSAAVSNPLRSAAGGAKCDMYLTVTRAAAQFAGTNQTVGGLGIVSKSTILGDQVFVHAIFNLRTYDSNLNHLRTERASKAPLLLTGLGGAAMYGMEKSVDASWFPAVPKAAAQSAQLKNAVRALIDEGLKKELAGIFQ
jgi:hypothetical protein